MTMISIAERTRESGAPSRKTGHSGKPRAFAKARAGEALRVATGECSLGAIVVAATGQGICAILLGDSAGPLMEGLKARFPKAGIAPGDADFQHLAVRVIAFVESPTRTCDLTLDVRGTPFQRKVWEVLRQIPPGKTMTYAQVAAEVGRPKAVRAVAQACASNALAVAIPCHRVVRTGGALSGYRWGVERKAKLLEREASS
jgi:AraC family transcriptional regulator of adaptative response/methylated-DNA-[protein]-cysteine methyltransferase